MRGPDGGIGITCEFCSTHYSVEPAEVEAGAWEAIHADSC